MPNAVLRARAGILRALVVLGCAVGLTAGVPDADALPTVDTIDGSGLGTYSGTVSPTDVFDWFTFQMANIGATDATAIEIEVLSAEFQHVILLVNKATQVVVGDTWHTSVGGTLINVSLTGNSLLNLSTGEGFWAFAIGPIDGIGNEADLSGGAYTVQLRTAHSGPNGAPFLTVLPIAGDVQAVPEPTTLLLLGVGLLGVGSARRFGRN